MSKSPEGFFAALQQAPQANRRDATVLNGRVEIVVLTTMLIANVVHVSAIFDVFYDRSTFVALLIQCVTFAVYGYVAVARGHVRVLAFAALLLGYLIAQCFLFSSVAGASVNVSASLSVATLLMVVVFYETKLPLGTILLLMLGVYAGYLFLYDVLGPAVLARRGTLDSRLLLTSDGQRDDRVFLAGQYAVFVLYTGVLWLRTRPWAGVVLVLLSGYAIYLAQSRMFQSMLGMTFLVALAGSVFPRTRRPVTIILALMFLVLAIAVVWGYFDTSFNPYNLVSGDASGRARFVEYGDAVRSLGSRYLTGVGIGPSVEAVQLFVKQRTPFFAADLGTGGVMFEYGLIGTTLFLVASTACILAIPGASVRPTPLSLAFHYTTLQAALVGFFSTAILGGAGTVFASLTFALWLKGGYFGVVGRRESTSFSEIDPNSSGLNVGTTGRRPAGNRRSSRSTR